MIDSQRFLDSKSAIRNERYSQFQKFRGEFKKWSDLIKFESAIDYYNFRVFETPQSDLWQVGLTGNKRKISLRGTKASIFSSNWEYQSILEEGAELLYEMDDRGYVMCSIYGYRTSYSSAPELMILLDAKIDPRALAEKGIPLKHWRDFQAYMRVTCVDSVSSVQDRLRINWLRWSRPLLDRNRKISRTRFSLFGQRASVWIPVTIVAAIISAVSELLVQLLSR